MKSILFLAYYYPPVNNAGTQRIEKFVKYLPDFGVRPIILTTSYFSRRYDRMKSFTLAKRLDRKKRREGKETLVYRAGELRNLVVKGGGGRGQNIAGYGEIRSNSWQARIKQFIKTWFLFPDSKITWLAFAFFYALWIIKKYRVEYVVSSFPPATSHLLGLFLKRCTYVKWIADFRDGWCLDPLEPVLTHSPTRLFLEKILETAVVKNCDQILVTSPDVGEYFKEYRDKITLLFNGYDEQDFILAERDLGKFERLEKYFIISHTGAFYYSHPGNTPRYFLQALKELFLEHPEMKAKTQVFFLGNLTLEEKKMAHRTGLGTRVKVLGLKPHIEAVQYRLISDVLLLVDRPMRGRSSYIHGKVFEHLRARKPILALLPEGACRDFLAQLGVGEIIEPQDIAGIKKKLWELFSEWQRGGILRYELTNIELARFERKNLSKKLAEILK